ncbi:hypothetical protein Q4488_04105 [Amphritea sp. 1_MG-2023]|uniref:hypothetical protein n=1 Tax=Amphritea sp. 1_MG-2023 TaxID=3062670 RepID=UPI0026E3BAD6|nr:hypothetical protein [Amphritea sp. 1_MG-2023]MDO6562561.1 hypothetical protein [Amphritea sp. 1_MG-2023]
MVMKVLLTLLVLLIAYVYLQRRALRPRETAQMLPRERAVVDESCVVQPRNPVKLIAIMFIVVCFALTVSFFTYRWFDGHQLLQVTLISPHSDSPLYYQVRKAQLQERSFTTQAGQIIRIGDQDRLQIEPLIE